MMTNLFSIFDPSTPSFLSANWFSASLFILLFPMLTWLSQTRLTYLYNSLTEYLFTEFKPLAKKTSFMLIIPISFFFFILMNNVMGLLPYIFTATSHLTFSLTFALTSWLALMMYGLINNLSNILVHLIPHGTPTVLMPFMVIIETISNVIRPGTLAIRLSANMIAGHLLIVLLSSASIFTPLTLFPILFGAQVALSILEIAVAFIQAYVFSILTTLYVAEATN